MSSNRKEIDFSTDEIASYYDIKDCDNKLLREAKKYLSNHHFNAFQILRFIHLLKITDNLITDEGIVNGESVKKLQDISKAVDGQFREKVECLLSDIAIISKIKERNINELSKEELIDFININNTNIRSLLFNGGDPFSSIEDYILLVSKALMVLLKQEQFDLERLNNYSNNDFQPSDEAVKYFNFRESVTLWKYAGASLEHNNDEYVMNAWNEMELNFIVTRDAMKEYRLRKYWEEEALLGNNETHRRYAILYGIVRLWNKEIPEGDDIERCLKSNIVIALLNEKVYGVTLEKWIVFFDKLQAYFKEKARDYLNYSKPFIKLPIIKLKRITGLNEDEVTRILKNCLMSNKHDNDLYDSPIIFANDEYYTYVPLWLDFDAVYTISNIMRRCRNEFKALSMIGGNFERDVNNMLKKKGFDTKVNQKYQGHEIDILVKDQKNKKSTFIECKTFTPPTSIKDYAIQIEKIISHRHVSRARKNFDCLERNSEVLNFIKGTCVREVYLPNIFIPELYRDYLNRKGILYIQYFSFKKLLTTRPELLNVEFNSKKVSPCVHLMNIENPVNLDCNNLLGQNLNILNDKQPLLTMYKDSMPLFYRAKKGEFTEYEHWFFRAREKNCGFIKNRILL